MGLLDKFSPDSLLSGGTQLGGNIISSIANAIGARKQHQRQKELMQIQLDNNLTQMNHQSILQQEQWQQQFDAINAYNDPAANRDRLLAAGINPLHSEGSFSSASPSSNISGGGSAPSVPLSHRTDIMSGVSQMIDSRTKEKQFEVDSQKTHQEIQNMIVEMENLKKEGKLTDKKAEDFQSQIDTRKAQVDEETKRTKIMFRNFLVSEFSAKIQGWSARNDAFFRERQLGIEEQNAATMYNESVTHQQELQLEKEKLLINTKQFNANYKIAVANINLAITQAKWDDIRGLLSLCKDVSTHHVDSSMEISLGKSTTSSNGNKEDVSHSNSSGEGSSDAVRNSSSSGGKSGSKTQSRTKSSHDNITTKTTNDLFNSIIKGMHGEVNASYKGETSTERPDYETAQAIVLALSEALDAKYEYFKQNGDAIDCAKILELQNETNQVMRGFFIRRGALNFQDFPELMPYNDDLNF